MKDAEFLKVKGGSLRLIFQNKKISESKKLKKLIKIENSILKNIDFKFKRLQKLNLHNKNQIMLVKNNYQIIVEAFKNHCTSSIQ